MVDLPSKVKARMVLAGSTSSTYSSSSSLRTSLTPQSQIAPLLPNPPPASEFTTSTGSTSEGLAVLSVPVSNLEVAAEANAKKEEAKEEVTDAKRYRGGWSRQVQILPSADYNSVQEHLSCTCSGTFVRWL